MLKYYNTLAQYSKYHGKPFAKFFIPVIILIMKVDINPRGNGACPICLNSGNCRIQDTLSKTLDNFSKSDDPMELVVYSCPQFQERPDHE